MKAITFSILCYSFPYKCKDVLCGSLLVAVVWCWLLSHLLGKTKKKKCDAGCYKTEGQRPQWLAMPFHSLLRWSSRQRILGRSKKTLKVTGKLFMRSSGEQKVIYHWVHQNCWPLSQSTAGQWFSTRGTCNLQGYCCSCSEVWGKTVEQLGSFEK